MKLKYKNLLKNTLIALLVLFFSKISYSQQAIELNSKSLTIPRYLNIGAINASIPSPVKGILVFNETSKTMMIYDGSIWKDSQNNWESGSSLIYNLNDRVGIGTPTPAAKLDVNTTNSYVSQFNGASPMYMGIFENNLYRGYWGSFSGNSEDIDFGTGSGNTSGKLHLTIQSNPQLTINSNGNIGIGNTNPISRLDVLGLGTTSSTNTFSFRNSLGDTLFRMRDDGRMGIAYNGSSYGRTLNLGGTGINFYTANEAAFGGAVFPTDTSLVIWSNSASNNYLVLQPSWGNTGIGTYTPNAKFHVNGNMLIGGNTIRIAAGSVLSVNGRITATDVVTLPYASWPDFVFEENYKLISLENLEKKIKKEKHLPNIPSALEIQKNGISSSLMISRLLEKVEELTLYLIELNKSNEELKNRIINLENNEK